MWLGSCPGRALWVCVLGGGSPNSVAQRRDCSGGGSERVQVNGRSPSGPGSGYPGRRRWAVRPGRPGRWPGAPHPGGELCRASALRLLRLSRRLGDQSRGRDPPRAGAQPCAPTPAGSAHSHLLSRAAFSPLCISESNVFDSLRTSTRDYCVTQTPTELKVILVEFSPIAPVFLFSLLLCQVHRGKRSTVSVNNLL